MMGASIIVVSTVSQTPADNGTMPESLKVQMTQKNQVVNKHYHAQCCHAESNAGLSSFLSDLKSRLKGGIYDDIPTNLENQTYNILMECNIY